MSSGITTRSHTKPRRSQRLNTDPSTPTRRGRSTARMMCVEVPARPSKRRRVASDPADGDPAPKTTPKHKDAAPKHGAPSSSTSPPKRLDGGSVREQQYLDTERRLAEVEARVEELNRALDAHTADSAADALAHLEDSFACPLCLDVMTCPYSLVAYRCGHSFCALCLLKWYFSRLHGCGQWHDPVDCPLCRAPAPSPLVTDEPRPDWTCPFLPNRALDALLRDAVERVRAAEEPQAPPSRKKRGRKKASSPPSAPLAGWADSGHRRADWLARDAMGRDEMQAVVNAWSELGSHECLAIKARLAV
ncbi:hypothetical protein BV25DRAFT_1837185 [Artomyces pyxidatus]|uniref:Uncharacterized protein n=1 Tax=Artomyces pyxidatus TaxID=48021 RepID=A0ACB8T679_9AGAM|nr:hypothetical protein BV25DRAFT_1837185 [Artomyces pyxidatus]